MEKLIYLDNAATTKTRPEVVEAMLPYFTEYYGNPSSVYTFSSESKKAVTNAREIIAKSLGAKTNEIYFTAGGSESDNWALVATAEAYSAKGKHIITSKIEHHAILHTCQYLEKRGYEVTYLDVDENGVVKLDELKKAIRPDTILISIMFANNEIGTIEPIKEIGEIAKEHGILFHTDAVQAYAHVPINVDECHIDMLSSSGHKLNGPKGIGFLYIRTGVKIRSFIHGGAQERKRRAGTENVPGIVGYGKAAQIAMETMDERIAKETQLRDYLIKRVTEEVPFTRVNGSRTNRLPNNVNFAFQFIEGESLLIKLDMAGICGSSGSACTSGSLDPSHVLLAIGLPHEIAHGSLRLTLSEENTMEEMDYVVDQIKEIVSYLRGMSPLYGAYMRDAQKKNKWLRQQTFIFLVLSTNSPPAPAGSRACQRGAVSGFTNIINQISGGNFFMYSEKVMDHFQHPRNVGEIEDASGVGTVGNPKCGDIMRIYLDIDENQIIRDVKFKTFGCGAAVATSSMATELVKGKTVQEAMEVTNKAVMEALDGLPPVKVHCSLLAEEAIHAALWDYAQKNGIKIEGLEQPKENIGEEEEEEDY